MLSADRLGVTPMTQTTTLSLAPDVVVALGLLGLTLLIYGALFVVHRDWPGALWSGLSTGWRVLVAIGAQVWLGLLVLVFVAAVKGTLDIFDDSATAGLGLGGLLVALLGSPFLIWTTWLKHRTVEFQKEGHMTDRISKAVEQLGAEKTVKRAVDGKTVETTEPNLEVRIGAILSLERIAQDSTNHDRGRDHVRVMEILCAYIRHNAPAKDARDFPLPDWEPLKDDPTPEERETHQNWRKARFEGGLNFQSNARQWARNLGPPRADVAEALKILGRRSRAQMLVEVAWPHPPKPDTRWPFDNAPHLPDDPGDTAITPEALRAYKERLESWKQGTAAYAGYRLDLRGTNLQGTDLSKGWF